MAYRRPNYGNRWKYGTVSFEAMASMKHVAAISANTPNRGCSALYSTVLIVPADCLSMSSIAASSDFSSLAPPMLENSRYALWDLRGSLQLTRVIAFTGAVDNLTDSDHMDPLGYPVLGRAIRVGVRTKW